MDGLDRITLMLLVVLVVVALLFPIAEGRGNRGERKGPDEPEQ